MDPSPPRDPPLVRAVRGAERAAAAAAQAAAAAAPTAPANDDCADALPGDGERRPQWRAVWRRARDRLLPRELRGFAWMLLHAALSCGGAQAAFWSPGQPGLADAVCCSNAACRAAAPGGWPLETLLHALLDCPAVRPALRWLADLWPRFAGGSTPPLTAEVWLQDSPAAWRPHAAQAGAEARAHAEQRWAYLRLAVLEAAWRLRCKRRRGGQQFEAADVVEDVIEGVERRVLADWQRTSPAMLDAAGTCLSWFPRRRRPMDHAQFEALWCAGGVIARLAPGATPAAPGAVLLCFGAWRLPRASAAGGGGVAAAAAAAGGGGGVAAAAAMAAAAATAAAAALPPAPAGAGGGGRLPQYAASMPADVGASAQSSFAGAPARLGRVHLQLPRRYFADFRGIEVGADLYLGGAGDGPDPAEVGKIAARQLQVYAAKARGLQRVGAGGALGRRRREELDAALAPIYHAAWMDPSPPRDPPLVRAVRGAERAAAAAAQAAAAAAPTAPANDDCADALPGDGERRPQWRAVWRRARDRLLPRELRGFAWMLLHAALSCGGAQAAFWSPGQPGLADAVCCSNAACRAAAPGGWPLETLLHALLDCPAVRPALRWLADLWPRFAGGSTPPLTAEVWRQDSPAAWRPHAAQAGAEARAHAEQRWAYLRLAVLEAAWRLRCKRRRGGQQFEAADVVEDVIEGVERRVLADWQRTSPAMLDAAGTCLSWFPRRRRPMDHAQFEALWCAGGVIARLAPGATPAAPGAVLLCFGAWRLPRASAAGGGGVAAAAAAAGGGGGVAAAAAMAAAAATAAAAALPPAPAGAGGGGRV
ncbi:MAG: hypothetical protein J3K34DRAFT_527483 [Monoraphidium minutum]|nr:MAG: hypothetical protein J3K34DRAFT_527483 [Monoraphidium minutum]